MAQVMPVDELRFPVDRAQRRRLLPWGSVHEPIFPAKMSLGLLRELVHRYTRPGDVVLDPFGGCGSTMLAALEGRHVVLVELEPHWVEACRKNAEHLSASLAPPTGQIVIRQGDSRYDLVAGAVPFADALITSPPYHADIGREGRTHSATHYLDRMAGGRVVEAQHAGYAEAVLTSPPYADRYAYADPETRQADDPTAGVKGRIHRPYGQQAANIGNLRRYGSVDAVLTSPPYERAIGGDHSRMGAGVSALLEKTGRRASAAIGSPEGYGRTDGSIGRLKGQTYLEAMALVYAGCYAALRPGGVIIVVVGNVVRDGAEVRLDLDTSRLLEAAGFRLRETLVHLKRPSFFRVVTQKRKPDLPIIDREYVLVADKPEGGE